MLYILTLNSIFLVDEFPVNGDHPAFQAASIQDLCLCIVCSQSRHILRLGVPNSRENRDVILLMEEILHQLIGSFSYYLQGFIHPRWLAGFLNHQQCVWRRLEGHVLLVSKNEQIDHQLSSDVGLGEGVLG